MSTPPESPHRPSRPLLGRVALVTGCGRPEGIGNAVARRLAADGATVVVSDVDTGKGDDRSDERLEVLVDELVTLQPGAMMVLGDVSSASDAARIVDQAVDRNRRLDILVNNAAAPKREESGSIEDVEPAEWDRVMAINAGGHFLMCRAAIPAMKAAGWGRIINVSSLAGRVGLSGLAVYCASKHASVGLTRAIALDLAPFGITANAVCPGPILTDRTRDAARRAGVDVDGVLAARAAAIPVGRLGTPTDVAEVVGFLASDASGFITGQVLGIDGGSHVG